MITLSLYEATPNEELEQLFAAEMVALASSQHEPVVLQLQPMDAFVLCSMLQLAHRQVAFEPAALAVAEAVINQLAACFAPGSAIAETIRRGWRLPYD